jgi:GNAT superfamily N-acetyltransferase
MHIMTPHYNSESTEKLRQLCRDGTLTLTPYSPEFHTFYEEQNRAWVSKYFTIEPIDDAMLRDPQTHILHKGGYIYIGVIETYPVGGFSLIPDGNCYELSKMYVPETLQGLGIGDKLVALALQEARTLGAQSVQLLSNTKLSPAIHLYRKHGFVEVPIAEDKQGMYARANIMMVHRFDDHTTQAA